MDFGMRFLPRCDDQFTLIDMISYETYHSHWLTTRCITFFKTESFHFNLLLSSASWSIHLPTTWSVKQRKAIGSSGFACCTILCSHHGLPAFAAADSIWDQRNGDFLLTQMADCCGFVSFQPWGLLFFFSPSLYWQWGHDSSATLASLSVDVLSKSTRCLWKVVWHCDTAFWW